MWFKSPCNFVVNVLLSRSLKLPPAPLCLHCCVRSDLKAARKVVTDNDYQTWKAYNVAAWPTMFLLDKQGRIRWMHVGEGDYGEAERLIQKLLEEKETSSEDKNAV
jgi:hypothetical protein